MLNITRWPPKLVTEKTPRDTSWNPWEYTTTWGTRDWLALITMKPSRDGKLHHVVETCSASIPFNNTQAFYIFWSHPPFIISYVDWYHPHLKYWFFYIRIVAIFLVTIFNYGMALNPTSQWDTGQYLPKLAGKRSSILFLYELWKETLP